MLDCLTRHLLSRPTPPGVEVTVVAEPGAVPAYRIAVDHPAIRAGTSALQSISPGSSVLLDVVAGTLPATTMFERELGAKTMFFSFSTSDENLHGPDEFFRVARIGEGMRAWERLWRLLADDLAPGRG